MLTLPNGRAFSPLRQCASIFPGFVAARNLSFCHKARYNDLRSPSLRRTIDRISFLAPKCSPPKKKKKKKGRLVLAGLSPAPEKGAFPTSIWVNGHSSPTMPTWSIMTLSWRQTFEVRSGEDVVACESRPWINTYPVFNQDERKCCTWLVGFRVSHSNKWHEVSKQNI